MAAKNISFKFPAELADSLSTTYQGIAETLKEAAVLELYREGKLASGKAAEILNMERFEFIRYAGKKGIPYIRLTADEVEADVKLLGRAG